MFPSSGAALDEPVAMIDHEGDDDNDVQLQQDGADEEEAAGVVRPQMSEKPCTTSSTSASANRSNSTDELPSLGAIFQTAYTSNSQSSNPSQNAARTGGGSNSGNSSSSSSTPGASLLPNPYSATASGPRISSTSDLFAPEDIHDVFFEDSSSQLFAESDQDDEVDQHHHAAVVGAERVQALFVDTSSPRRSPMPPGSVTSGGGAVPSSSIHPPPGFVANAAARSSNPDPFVFYPTPLLTSTPSS